MWLSQLESQSASAWQQPATPPVKLAVGAHLLELKAPGGQVALAQGQLRLRQHLPVEVLGGLGQGRARAFHEHALEALLPERAFAPVGAVEPLGKPLLEQFHELADVVHAVGVIRSQPFRHLGLSLSQGTHDPEVIQEDPVVSHVR